MWGWTTAYCLVLQGILWSGIAGDNVAWYCEEKSMRGKDCLRLTAACDRGSNAGGSIRVSGGAWCFVWGVGLDHSVCLVFALVCVCGVWCVWCVLCGVWCVWCVLCGVCCVVCGVWCVVCGVWCVVCGVWCVVCGVWCVVCGVWCVVCGVSDPRDDLGVHALQG